MRMRADREGDVRFPLGDCPIRVVMIDAGGDRDHPADARRARPGEHASPISGKFGKIEMAV